MPRGLGERQKGVLAALKTHKQWYVGCGWLWDTHSGTTLIMDSLVARGLVTKEDKIIARATRTVYKLKDHADH